MTALATRTSSLSREIKTDFYKEVWDVVLKFRRLEVEINLMDLTEVSACIT